MAKGFGPLVLTPQQERESQILRKSVLKHFQHLPDPRTGRRKDHNLVAIITIAILAVLCGADGFVAIETYGKANQVWLETFLVLAQQKVDSKSNEITAVPLLLKLLNLKGAIVTLDAMGTQIEIARQIKQAEGDYVLALKGNQGKRNQQVEAWFKQAESHVLKIACIGCLMLLLTKMPAGFVRDTQRKTWDYCVV